MNRENDCHPEEGVIEPSDLDILLGQHEYCFHHIGNRCFRTLIANNSEWYAMESDKKAVVAFLFNLIQRGGGRFLREDLSSNQWHQVDNRTVWGKISQALRDKGNQQMFRNTSTHERQGTQHRPFVARFISPDCWSSLVIETPEEESMKAYKKFGVTKEAISFNLQRGTQHDVDTKQPGSDIKLKQTPDSNVFAENRHDTVLSNSWPAQRTSTLTPVRGEMSTFISTSAAAHHLDARAMESCLDCSSVHRTVLASGDHHIFPGQTPDSWRYSLLEPLQESWGATTSDMNRWALDDVPGTNVERKQAPFIFPQQRHHTILSEAWAAQHASPVPHTEGMGDIYPRSVTTNNFNSRGIPVIPRLVSTTRWPPYAPTEPRSARSIPSLRRHLLGDMPLDNSQEAYSSEMGKLCKDFGDPLPLIHDSHISGDIAECLGQSSLAQGANADSGAEEHDTLNDLKMVGAHEINSREVGVTTQLEMPDVKSSTDQQLDAMITDLFGR